MSHERNSELISANLPKWHVRLLAEIYAAGLGCSKPSDRQCILTLISLVRPESPEVLVSQSMEFIQARKFSDARSLLEAAIVVRPEFAQFKALLAWTLFSVGDGQWQTHAEETLALTPDGPSMKLIDALCKVSGIELRGFDVAPSEPKGDYVAGVYGIAC